MTGYGNFLRHRHEHELIGEFSIFL